MWQWSGVARPRPGPWSVPPLSWPSPHCSPASVLPPPAGVTPVSHRGPLGTRPAVRWTHESLLCLRAPFVTVLSWNLRQKVSSLSGQWPTARYRSQHGSHLCVHKSRTAWAKQKLWILSTVLGSCSTACWRYWWWGWRPPRPLSPSTACST